MLTAQDYQYLYKLTDFPTPLRSNCGLLCEQVCCAPGINNDLGVYLFPGEEIMFTRQEDWLIWENQDPEEQQFPDSWTAPVHFLRCIASCSRHQRPLACRFFPLAPYLQQDNHLLLIYETMALPYRCPLIYDDIPLWDSFVRSTQEAWRIMLSDHRIKDYVVEESRYLENQGLPIRLATTSPL